MLSRSYGFVFIHIPKTGGNSLQVLLETYSEDRRVCGLTQDYWNRFEIRGPITSLKHQDLATYVERLGIEVVASLKKVTFVRNPFDRAMSYYFSPHRWVETQAGELVVKTPHFDRYTFIEEISRLPPMVEYLRVDGEIVTMDFVGRFERFDADVARAMAFLGIDASDTRPPHVNRSTVEDQFRFYDNGTLNFVRQRFEADFNFFGYRTTGPR
jgi:hypothetical protein